MALKFWLIERDSFAGRLIQGSAESWHAYTEHQFVAALADGTLSEASFKHYLVQDYLFLMHFARAWALAAYKAEDFATIKECAEIAQAIGGEETKLHLDYCAGFGLDEAAMSATPEEPENMAYTRFVMERGLSGDLLDLLVALAPCVIGYGEIGKRLVADTTTNLGNNPYKTWIETYAGDQYAEIVAGAVARMNHVASQRIGDKPWTSPRWTSLQKTFEQATRLEVGFWSMGIKVT